MLNAVLITFNNIFDLLHGSYVWGEEDGNSNPLPRRVLIQQFLKFSEHFIKLRRLKNYLSCTMSQNRRNGLAVLNIYRHVEVNVNTVLNDFFPNVTIC